MKNLILLTLILSGFNASAENLKQNNVDFNCSGEYDEVSSLKGYRGNNICDGYYKKELISQQKKLGQIKPTSVDISCPDNYVEVPALEGYRIQNFCVMKYEAKRGWWFNATSKASGTPYVEVSRVDAINKCTGIGEGYDLITNNEWQSIARSIELVPDNWHAGVVGSVEGLSRGHSDWNPFKALAASSDDTRGCEGTEQTCSNTVWDSQRRTHTLPNGEVIWDIAGNVWEWIKDEDDVRYSFDHFNLGDSNLRFRVYSLDELRTHLRFTPYSHYGDIRPQGLGDVYIGPKPRHMSFGWYGNYGSLDFVVERFNYTINGILRGGDWKTHGGAGPFAASLGMVYPRSNIGFRCVFRP